LPTYQTFDQKTQYLQRHPSTPASRKVLIMKLLHIDSSVLGANSVSRALTARTVAEWQATHPGTTVEYLDLAVDAPSLLIHQAN
jgi:FMN-dependent NADH-azoreductase